MSRAQRAQLPARANLDHLKSQAKDLLEAFRANDVEARARIRTGLPSAHGREDAALSLALHDAQSVVAREYGFDSWAALKKHVEDTEPTKTLIERQMPHAKLPSEVEAALIAAAKEAREGKGATQLASLALPPSLPMIALRNALLSVGAMAPLAIQRPSSLEAIAKANGSPNANGKLLAIFSQKDEANESPSLQDLHSVGAVVLLKHVHAAETSTWIIVHAVRWVRLERLEGDSIGGSGAVRAPAIAHVTPFEVDVQSDRSAEIAALEAKLRERVKAFAAALPNGAEIVAMTSKMSPLELADITIANLPCSVELKARYASEPRLESRLDYVLRLMQPS